MDAGSSYYRTAIVRSPAAPWRQGGIPANYVNAQIAAPQHYDLPKDPGEKTDVAAANPEVVIRLP